jgi:hypothetical protein
VAKTLALTAAFVAFTTPAFAQKAAPSSDNAELRAQVRTMERVFSSAIQNGVDTIARKMNAVSPGIRLFAGQPHAHGFQVENFGWFFDVEVPEVQEAIVDLLADLQRQPPPSAQTRVGNRTTVVAPPAADTAILEDPQGEYRKAIRNALIDAMLDFGQIPLKANEELTVGARGADSPMPGMESSSTIALILRISGSDLTAFRQGKITRAEAKARVKIHEYER